VEIVALRHLLRIVEVAFVPITGTLPVKAGVDAQNVNPAVQQVKTVAVQKHDGWFPMANCLQMVPQMQLFILIVKNLFGLTQVWHNVVVDFAHIFILPGQGHGLMLRKTHIVKVGVDVIAQTPQY
jgi:hypothetical protein